MLLHCRLRFIPFDHRRYKLVDHRIEKEHTMESDTRAFPRQDRILGFLKGASGGIEAHPLCACLEYLPYYADRGLQAFHEGIFRLGAIDRTVITFVNDAATMILCGIGRMRLQDSRVAHG